MPDATTRDQLAAALAHEPHRAAGGVQAAEEAVKWPLRTGHAGDVGTWETWDAAVDFRAHVD